MPTTTELYNNVLAAAGGEVDPLDNTETALLRKILKAAGGNCEEITDNLKCSLLCAIADAIASGGGTSGGDPSDIGAEKYIEAQHAEVVLPNATAIKPYAFATDTVLSSVSMPKVKNIGTSGFSQCSNLVITNFHEGLERIDSYAFMACQKFVVISFPTSMKFIGDRAFQNCSEIKTVTFKTKPGTIGSIAFISCGNLKTINVPWAEGEVANAPWGATNATINYNYTGE